MLLDWCDCTLLVHSMWLLLVVQGEVSSSRQSQFAKLQLSNLHVCTAAAAAQLAGCERSKLVSRALSQIPKFRATK